MADDSVPQFRADRQPSPDPRIDPIPGIIQHGSVNLLAGAPGVGKTALIAGLLRQLRDGQPVFGRSTHTPPKIAYLCADRGWHVAHAWLTRAGFPDIPHYSLTDDHEFDLNKLHNKRARLVVFRDCLRKLEPLPVGSSVVVDPIALFMGGNLNDYDTCGIFLMGIRRIAQELGISILGSCHASKQKADKKDQYKRLQDRILGSAAQHGYGDTQMYLAAPEETGEDFYTFLWHPHLDLPEVIKLQRTETGLFVPWDGAARRSSITLDDTPIRAPQPEEGLVLAAIPEPPAETTFGAIITAVPDVSRATIHRYLQRLLKEGVIAQPGHGRYTRPGTH